MTEISQQLVQEKIAETSNQFLKYFCFTLLFLQSAAFLASLLTGSRAIWPLNIAALVVNLAAIIAITQRKMKIARWIIVVPMLVLLLIWPFFVSGARSPTIALFSSMILTVGWIFGRRPMFIAACLIGVLIVALAFTQINGWIEYPIAERPTQSWAITWFAVTSYVTLAGWFLLRTFETLLLSEAKLRKQLDDANALIKSELITTTEALEQSDEHLDHVQKEFEKAYPMANMAAVVPGVAHDLNTPVGNTNMAVSTMRDQLKEFEGKVNGGSIRKADLSSFMESLNHGLAIIERANARAGDLVASLKELSIDQASQRRRQFDVGTVIHDIVSVMTPSLKKGPASIQIDVEPNLILDSFPGPLGQILTNLIQNTVVHAFEGRDKGTITIRAHRNLDNQILISVEDDGVGMSDEILSRIFQNYFTTKLGKGGSGVGLALSQRLAKEVLAGDLTVESTLGRGSKFMLSLPVSAIEQTL